MKVTITSRTQKSSESESEADPTIEEVDHDSENGPDEETDGGSSEEQDVDQEGMEKLMAALGEDGLDEFAQAELRALVGETEDEDQGSGSEVEGEEEEVSDGEDENEDPEEDEEDNQENDEPLEDIPLDEAESVDEDAVLKQKVEIDNKVSTL